MWERDIRKVERRPEVKARRVMWWGAMEGGMCGQRGVKRWSFRGRRGRSNIFFLLGGGGGDGDGGGGGGGRMGMSWRQDVREA